MDGRRMAPLGGVGYPLNYGFFSVEIRRERGKRMRDEG
jgi:hypothetical protein